MIAENGAKVFLCEKRFKGEENSTERRAQHAAPLQGDERKTAALEAAVSKLRMAS
jgi:hypothetical protein